MGQYPSQLAMIFISMILIFHSKVCVPSSSLRPVVYAWDSPSSGTSRISVQSPYFPNETHPHQTFLKLHQPINETFYPNPRVLRSGYTYRFSFAFVVPTCLLPPACSHEKSNYHIERSHTLLPPTLGELDLASNGKCRLDDMCPDACGISYFIRVSVLKRSKDDGTPCNTVVSRCKKVRVIPTVEEEPPLSIPEVDSGYCMRKEKDIRRSFLHKLGRLVVSAAQPTPIQLTIPNCIPNESGSTVVTLDLQFQPVGEEQPPQLGSVRSGIRVFTFCSTHPWTDYPSPSFEKCLALLGCEVHSTTVTCPTLSIASTQWVKNPTNYTASVNVPITLPKDKFFVPTFHSCWISRIYSLGLSVSYHAAKVNIMNSTASLMIPIQIANQRNNEECGYQVPGGSIDVPPPAYSDC